MTDVAVTYQKVSAPETPFETLKRLTDEADQLEAEQTELNERIKANLAERQLIALSIYKSDKLTDGSWALHPTYKTRTKTDIDVEKLRKNYPEIYSRAHPYVSDNVAMDILEEANNGDMDTVQSFLKEINPELFEEKAKLRIPELEKAVSTEEKLALEQEGIIKISAIPVGEPRICPIEFVKALSDCKKKRSTKKHTEAEEE